MTVKIIEVLADNGTTGKQGTGGGRWDPLDRSVYLLESCPVGEGRGDGQPAYIGLDKAGQEALKC